MLPWGAMAGTLTLNYWQHRRNRPTICSTTRRFVPKPVVVVALCVGFAGLVAHVIDGYSIKIDLGDLTD